jgi:DNA ligase-1
MGDKDCPITVVDQIKLRDARQLKELHSKVTKLGAEGSMIREPDSMYEFKRSKNLLKVKDFEEVDARVVSIDQGTGKYSKTMGRLNVELVSDPSIKFGVGSGFSDEERNNAKKLYRPGTIISVKHQGFTADGIPRFPIYLGVHIDR